MSLMSGNTIGALYYTDGKRIAPMLPDLPYHIKCPKCGVFFKITNRLIKRPSKRDLPNVEFLSIDELRAAIIAGLYNAEKEGSKGRKEDDISLRLDLWRAFNDRVRNNSENDITVPWKNPDEKTAYETNCRELLILMNEDNNDTFYLLRAELHRNLGEFDECKRIMQKVSEPDNYEGFISAMTEACDNKNVLTFCL